MTLPYRDPASRDSAHPFAPVAAAPIAGELFVAALFTTLGLTLWWVVGAILHADLLTIVRAIG